MKKIFYVIAAVCGMCFASCGGNTASNATGVDSTVVDSMEVDSLVLDSTVCDTACIL